MSQDQPHSENNLGLLSRPTLYSWTLVAVVLYFFFAYSRIPRGDAQGGIAVMMILIASPLVAIGAYFWFWSLFSLLVNCRRRGEKDRVRFLDVVVYAGLFVFLTCVAVFFIATPIAHDKKLETVRETVSHEKQREYLNHASVRCNHAVMMNLADNTNASPYVMRQLAKDKYISVRGRVARNPAAPPDVLELLGADADENVRASVASNPNIPELLREKLKSDKNEYVRTKAGHK